MTFQMLAALIALREGKKSQARVADVREVLSVLTDLIAEEANENPGSATSIERFLAAQAAKKLAKKLRPARKKKSVKLG